LAWESGAQDVVFGNEITRYADVTAESPFREVEVPDIYSSELGIYLRRKDTVVAKAAKREVKAPKAGE